MQRLIPHTTEQQWNLIRALRLEERMSFANIVKELELRIDAKTLRKRYLQRYGKDGIHGAPMTSRTRTADAIDARRQRKIEAALAETPPWLVERIQRHRARIGFERVRRQTA